MGKNNDNYTHFAVNKQTNLIVNGWDYSDIDSQELRDFKNDYFINDLKDYGINPKEYKILSYRGCMRQGINPDDDCIWSNDGINSICKEYNKNNMNMKSINESQLRNIIAESIKNVLNELDWKTYANAAQKAYNTGPYGCPRSRRFFKAAQDALNRDYGYEKNYESGDKGSLKFSTPHDYSNINYNMVMRNPDVYDKFHYIPSKEYSDNGILDYMGPKDVSDDYYACVKYPYGGYEERKPYSDIYKGDKAFKNAIDKADKELSDYRNGNYEYQKGKGWKLKH